MKLTSKSNVVEALSFKTYCLKDRTERFCRRHEGEDIQFPAPWDSSQTLTAKEGDYLVSDKGKAGAPENFWVVDGQIFGKSYEETEGVCIKTAPVDLIPLSDVVDGSVTIETLEGEVTIDTPEDFHLARGVEGEIWPMENDRVAKDYVLA